MANTLLSGLSRQMTLERQMDVVANNVANINTTGFKADRSLFEEYLRSPAHEDNFAHADRRACCGGDGAPPHTADTPPRRRTARHSLLVGQAAAGERYTRDGRLQLPRRCRGQGRRRH